MATMHDIAQGFEILAQYTDNAMDTQLGGAFNGTIYGPKLVSELKVSVEHAEMLGNFGWVYLNEFDCWCYFVPDPDSEPRLEAKESK